MEDFPKKNYAITAAEDANQQEKKQNVDQLNGPKSKIAYDVILKKPTDLHEDEPILSFKIETRKP